MFGGTKLFITFTLFLLFCEQIKTISLITDVEETPNNGRSLEDIIPNLVRKNNFRAIVMVAQDKHITNEFSRFLKSRSEAKYVINLECNADRIGKFEENIMFMLYVRPNQSITVLFNRIRIMKFWKPRNRLFVFKDGITLAEIISVTNHVSFKYWAVNIVYWINGTSFARYNPFNKTMLTIDNSSVIRDICDNLYGTELVVGMIETLTAIWNGSHFVGRDAYMTDIIISELNATLTYLVDQNYIEILKRVIEGKADMSFMTRFLRYSSFDLVDYTYPHDQDDLIILIPVSSPKLEELIANIPGLVWFLLIIFSVLFLVYVRLFKEIEISEIMLMCVNMFTSRTVRTLAIPHFKLCLIVIVIVIFYINAAIQGTLASLLAKLRYPNEMVTIEEFIKSNYSITVDTNYWMVMESTSYTKALLPRCTFVNTTTIFVKLNSCMKEAFITTYQIAEYFKRNKQCYYRLKQHLFPNHMAYIMKYGTPLSNRINKILINVIESGLLDSWKKMTSPRIKSLGDNHPRKMKIESIHYTLIFMACGYICATIIFIFEILYHSYYYKLI